MYVLKHRLVCVSPYAWLAMQLSRALFSPPLSPYICIIRGIFSLIRNSGQVLISMPPARVRVHRCAYMDMYLRFIDAYPYVFMHMIYGSMPGALTHVKRAAATGNEEQKGKKARSVACGKGMLIGNIRPNRANKCLL